MNTFDVKDFDKVKEECGVFGIFSNEENLDVARLTNFGLFALQHRGQDACGIAVNDNGTADLADSESAEQLTGRLDGHVAVRNVGADVVLIAGKRMSVEVNDFV